VLCGATALWHAEPRRLSSRLSFAAALLGVAFSAASCERKSAPTATTRAAATASAPKLSAPAPAASAPAIDDEADESNVLEERRAPGGKLAGIEIGQVIEVGPAGAASAGADGVVMVTRAGEVLHLLPERLKAPIERPAADFAATARGPALADDFAYFVLEGKLVRRRIDGASAIETLTDDARSGARVSALPKSGKQPAAVAYITRADAEGTSVAKLWINGRTLTLTVEGAGASSVALVRTGDSKVLALSIDGRSAMTPVHARPLDLEAAEPRAGSDHVVWVAGSAEALTEIVAGSDGPHAWGFLPIAKDVSHFGLAELALPLGGQGDAEVSWRLYDNGIDMAPISAARICGSLLVAYARPLAAQPQAPQALVLSRPGKSETAVVVTARAFANASLAGGKDTGGLLVYVADRRTFALPLRCRP